MKGDTLKNSVGMLNTESRLVWYNQVVVSRKGGNFALGDIGPLRILAKNVRWV